MGGGPMIGVRRPEFESQLCHHQATLLGQVIWPFEASTHLLGLLQGSKMIKWWKHFVNQKVPYNYQLLLQCPMGRGKINKSPLFRGYSPKRKTKSHGLIQGAYLQSTKNFLCQWLSAEEGWFQAAGVMQEAFLKEKSTPLALGKAALLELLREKAPNAAPW